MFGVGMSSDHALADRVGGLESPLRRLLYVSRFHRIHPGLLLVGMVGLDPDLVLDLRWQQVDLDAGQVRSSEQVVPLHATVTDLLRWHAARQRLDRSRSLRWAGADQVLLDQAGFPFSMEAADFILRRFCEEAGLPTVPFSALRHPCLR